MLWRVRLAATAAVALASLAAAAFAGAAPGSRIVFAATVPSVASGHIYVVPPGGSAHDLSPASGGDDFLPTVSPDGTHIAFISTRSGRAALYTMGLDGSSVERVSPFFGPTRDLAARISWQPESRSFAVLYDSSVYVATLGGGWRKIVPATSHANDLAGWSPDGTLLTYVAGGVGLVQTIAASGKERFRSAGVAASWSAKGRLAVERSDGLWLVYSESGRRLASVVAAGPASWSPDGSRFASVTPSGVLQVRNGGVGSPVFARRLSPSAGPFLWVGNDELAIIDLPAYGIRLSSGARVALPSVLGGERALVSPDGSQFAGVSWGANDGAGRLLIAAAAGGVRTVGTHPACPDGGPFVGLQFAPNGGFVYATDCDAPSAQIYAVDPDGSRVAQLLRSNYDDDEPSVSPDGSKIAFVRRATAGNCHGCEETVWLMNADGTGPHSFPNSGSDSVPYDNSPSFSPDGKTILFTRGGVEWNKLFTVPVAGGKVKALGISGSGSVWGPTRIAYLAGSSGAATTAKPDGTGRQTVAPPGWNGSDGLAWSEDGRLAVLEPAAKGMSILIPGRRIPLTGFRLGPIVSGGIAWSPDGRRLAFTAGTAKDPSGDVYTIDVDGTQLTQVTHGLGATGALSWR
jgi:Tol biopolymer transport system component